MKEPVSFKLKNGLTVVVAQNVGLGKIYSRLTIENQTDDSQKVAAQILENFLNSKATKFNEGMLENGKPVARVSMTFNEANAATTINAFEQTLSFVSSSFINPEITKEAFDEMKSTYTGNKADLASITIKDLQDFYHKNFKASDAYITIAGDITPSTAKLITNRVFGDWKTETAL
ncbi:hypothetical protein AQF98_13300 [Pedobacter sp. Hv1]|nr:hypothetical protein AQF98_13300 [Pedobacter sp. Hv1]